MSAPDRPASFRTPRKVLRRLRVLPPAMRTIRNWPQYIWNYALGIHYQGLYRFRNGARLKIGRAIDHAPIIEIFFNADYGQIADGSVIVDLGANIGIFSVYAITMARDVSVYAYEPLPAYYDLLLENARLNADRGRITAFNVAVAAGEGSRELFTEGRSLYFPTLIEPQMATGSVTVPCTSLSGILEANGLGRVDLLKMDCEGAEYEILYNTSGACFEKIAEIRMEYHNLSHPRENAGDLQSFLRGHGYEITHVRSYTPTNGCLWARRASTTEESGEHHERD